MIAKKKSKTFLTRTAKETQKLGESFAKKILKKNARLFSGKTAVIIALKGDLGSGKTTFLQGFAKGLGIKEKVLSPTFLIMRRFQFPASSFKKHKFANFFHVDCYRVIRYEELLDLNWRRIVYDPENIVAIEWPELIKPIMPEGAIKINFKFIDEKKRKITFYG